MKRLRKTTWTMLVWTVLLAVVTVAWMSADVSAASPLPIGEAVQVDDQFRVTLVSASPPTFSIENTTTSNATFSYSDVTMVDSAGTEHEPAFTLGQVSDTVPAGDSISKELDFGNIGNATAVSYHWECDACDVGEALGRGLVFVVMGFIYWFGMIVLFVIWLVTRPPRVVQVVVQSDDPAAD